MHTVQSNITNITPVGQSTQTPEHTTVNTPAQAQMTHSDKPKIKVTTSD